MARLINEWSEIPENQDQPAGRDGCRACEMKQHPRAGSSRPQPVGQADQTPDVVVDGLMNRVGDPPLDQKGKRAIQAEDVVIERASLVELLDAEKHVAFIIV